MIHLVDMAGTIKIIFLCVFGLSVRCGADYYWRDWNGTLPRDIFLAANDSRGDVYIAQAFLKNSGLFVGHIFSGQEEIVVNPTIHSGPTTTSNTLKVLCSPNPSSLLWIPSTRTDTPGLVDFIFPVIGGINNTSEPVYIGKFVNGSYTYVGNIHTDYYVYFSDITSDEGSAYGGFSDSYDLLIHKH